MSVPASQEVMSLLGKSTVVEDILCVITIGQKAAGKTELLSKFYSTCRAVCTSHLTLLHSPLGWGPSVAGGANLMSDSVGGHEQ